MRRVGKLDDVSVGMNADTKTDTKNVVLDSPMADSKPVENSPSLIEQEDQERRRRDERMIALYRELTGADEATARDVCSHLDMAPHPLHEEKQ